jgi:hypothetical protein
MGWIVWRPFPGLRIRFVLLGKTFEHGGALRLPGIRVLDRKGPVWVRLKRDPAEILPGCEQVIEESRGSE